MLFFINGYFLSIEYRRIPFCIKYLTASPSNTTSLLPSTRERKKYSTSDLKNTVSGTLVYSRDSAVVIVRYFFLSESRVELNLLLSLITSSFIRRSPALSLRVSAGPRTACSV